MYNWNQFRNFPKFKDMSQQEQARQYFLYQSNMMMEQSANAALAPAAAAAAAGAGGGGRLPKPEVKATESFLYWAHFNIEGNTSDQTLKSSSINFTDGTTEVYDSGLTYGEYDWYNYPYPIFYSYTRLNYIIHLLYYIIEVAVVNHRVCLNLFYLCRSYHK